MRWKINTLDELKTLIDASELKCRWCDGHLTSARLKGYQHPNGLHLADTSGPKWYYVSCECGYDWSIFKLFVLLERKAAAATREDVRRRYRLDTNPEV